MAKIMTTACPDHQNCTVRVTIGDGEELIEHIRTLMLSEADALNERLDAFERSLARIDEIEMVSNAVSSLIVGVQSEADALRLEFANVDTVRLNARLQDAQDRAATSDRALAQLEESLRRERAHRGAVRQGQDGARRTGFETTHLDGGRDLTVSEGV